MRMTRMDDHDFDVEESRRRNKGRVTSLSSGSSGDCFQAVYSVNPLDKTAIDVIGLFDDFNERDSAFQILVSRLFEELSLSPAWKDGAAFHGFCKKILYHGDFLGIDHDSAERFYGELIEYLRALTVNGFVIVQEHPYVFSRFASEFGLVEMIHSGIAMSIHDGFSFACVSRDALVGFDLPDDNIRVVVNFGLKVSRLLKNHSRYIPLSSEFLACCKVFERGMSIHKRDKVAAEKEARSRLVLFINKFIESTPNPSYVEDDDISLEDLVSQDTLNFLNREKEKKEEYDCSLRAFVTDYLHTGEEGSLSGVIQCVRSIHGFGGDSWNWSEVKVLTERFSEVATVVIQNEGEHDDYLKVGANIFVSYNEDGEVGRIDFPESIGVEDGVLVLSDSSDSVHDSEEKKFEASISGTMTGLSPLFDAWRKVDGIKIDDSVDEDTARRISEQKEAMLSEIEDISTRRYEDADDTEVVESTDIVEIFEPTFIDYVKLNALRWCKDALSWIIYMVVVSILSFFFGGG